MNTYQLIISTPDGNVFSDEAVSISMRGAEGELAVMAGHAPFITSVKECEIKLTLSDNKQKTAKIGGGILTVGKDKTSLLCSDFKWN